KRLAAGRCGARTRCNGRDPGRLATALRRIMKLTRRALLILFVWVVLLAGLGWFVQRQLQVGTDLRLFLPSPTTAEQRLLLEEIGEGPASRVMVISLA